MLYSSVREKVFEDKEYKEFYFDFKTMTLKFQKRLVKFLLTKEIFNQMSSILAKEPIEQKIKTIKIYRLVEIPINTISTYRKAKKPYFLFKMEEKYFITEIPKNFNFFAYDIIGEHLCSPKGEVCHRLSAAIDDEGGCQKVRDRLKNKRIEKYPWIKMGYETLHTKNDVFVVLECNHFSMK